MKEGEQIIQSANKEMQAMLRSVYNYNSSFSLSKEQKKLLSRILFAMSIIDRRFFVEEHSYFDTALGIGKGQTISQPSTVARMLMLAELKEGDNALEVGTGSGWNACLISFLVHPGNIISIERFLELTEKAQRNIKNLKTELKKTHPEDVEKIRPDIKAANIFEFSSKSNFDKIIITAGIKSDEQEKEIEKIASKLLKNNGVLICPRIYGTLLIFVKKDKKITRQETSEAYVFVPLEEALE
ncbi:hypothetical protein HYV49_05795 [Candidatus Pacearchaeota archaeon]|nr:hypothetical protein [Candidatus Pacearchaeota archaeon]